MVHADHVGRAGIVRDGLQPVAQAECGYAVGQRMVGADPAAQEVPGDPAPAVVVLGVLRHRGGGVGVAEVLGLHELSRGVHPADARHRKPRGVDLIEHRSPQGALVLGVREPVAVEATEPRRGERLVHGGVGVQPWVALGDRLRVGGEAQGEAVVVQKARPPRSRPMVDESGDGPHAEPANLRQAIIRPCEVAVAGVGR